MTDYLHKTRSICCHAYRVNRFMESAQNTESAQNRFEDRATIVGVPFGGLKVIEIKITDI